MPSLYNRDRIRPYWVYSGMDGVYFMKKIAKILFALFLILGLLWCGTVIADRQTLSDGLIRLHVVGASDTQEDQQVKLQVRDALMEYLQQQIPETEDVESAKAALKGMLSQLEETANEVLTAAGVADRAKVTLTEEEFPTRNYDTFSLPAGIYHSLRVTIGEGQGKNWWCVVFPSLCMPATTEGFADTAAGAGFSDSLSGALQGQPGYEIRFFLLDCMGWLQNLFSKG